MEGLSGSGRVSVVGDSKGYRGHITRNPCAFIAQAGRAASLVPPSENSAAGPEPLQVAYPISTRVNKPENDDSSIFEPLGHKTCERGGRQRCRNAWLPITPSRTRSQALRTFDSRILFSRSRCRACSIASIQGFRKLNWSNSPEERYGRRMTALASKTRIRPSGKPAKSNPK